MNSSTPTLTLEQRVALVWIRDHQPVMPPPNKVPSRVRVHLLRSGLIHFDPNRRLFDPVTFVLTDAGRRALSPLS
jgi:hypothetical protein